MKIGGVPEHFNAPWHIAMKKNLLDGVEWKEFPGGTGAMYKGLKDGEIDVAIMLTEGSLKFALEDSSIKIAGVYVASQAIWGLHAGAKSCLHDDIKDMKDNVTFAISRFGSGSHLMAFVLAEQLGWPIDNLKFEVVGNLAGAREALPANGDLVFMWEKFTTMPEVSNGTFKRVGELLTPWPFFVVVANASYLETNQKELSRTLSIVKKECELFKNGGDATIQYIQEHYHIIPEDAKLWLDSVTWACDASVDIKMLRNVADTLARLGQISTASDEQLDAVIA